MSGVLRLLVARATWRRWAYLVAGGALLMPYWFLAVAVVSPFFHNPFWMIVLIFGLPVPASILTGLVPAVRSLEGAAVKELVGGPLAGQPISRSRAFADRLRAACWFAGHLHAGVVVGFLSLAVPTFAVLLLILPFVEVGDAGGFPNTVADEWYGWLAPPAGLLMLVALVLSFAGAGALLAGLAPRFLGPSAAEKLADLETRAGQLAERNRLARELHDSVGHALSVVTLQAAAAGRVLDGDPEFARQALGAIEDSARAALEDLDLVLGVLRDDRGNGASPEQQAPPRTLGDLTGLLDKTRMAGIDLDAQVDEGLEGVPAAVSREAYRIVQEGLTNALRHAGKVPVRLRIAVHGDRLEVEVSNPLEAKAPGKATGGRGLRGINERVTVLRGQMTAGPDGGRWRVGVSLPLRSVP